METGDNPSQKPEAPAQDGEAVARALLAEARKKKEKACREEVLAVLKKHGCSMSIEQSIQISLAD